MRTAIPLVAACVAAAFASGPADAGARTVRADVYRTTVSLDVSYQHDQAYGPARMVDAGTAHIDEPGPAVELVDGELRQNVGVTLTRPAPMQGNAAMSLDNPDGDSDFCSGNTVTRAGSYVFGVIKGAPGSIWFAPWIAARFQTTCSDGGPSEFSVGPTRPADAARQSVPFGGERFYITKADLESERFSEPFDVALRGVQCPNFETAATTSCIATWRGTVTFERWIRGTKDVPDDKPARVQTTKNGKQVESSVRCRSRCSVELLIGVFGMRDGKPSVSPVKRVRKSASKGGTVEVVAKLSAADRRELGRGVAIAQLTVRSKGRKPTKQLAPLSR